METTKEDGTMIASTGDVGITTPQMAEMPMAITQLACTTTHLRQVKAQSRQPLEGETSSRGQMANATAIAVPRPAALPRTATLCMLQMTKTYGTGVELTTAGSVAVRLRLDIRSVIHIPSLQTTRPRNFSQLPTTSLKRRMVKARCGA